MTLKVVLRHSFPGLQLDVDFTAPQGLCALSGPSGAGKTTIINAISGILRADHAFIELDGRVLHDSARGIFLPPSRRRIGYVFQDGRLFPHLTVRQNLGYGRWFAPKGPGPDLAEIAAMLDITALLQRRPATLSGGEKQRVAIGRALLSRPQLLLLDEPLAALDQARKDEILPYLERLRDHARVPVLYVSHSAEEIARLAGQTFYLRAGRLTAAPQTASQPWPL